MVVGDIGGGASDDVSCDEAAQLSAELLDPASTVDPSAPSVMSAIVAMDAMSWPVGLVGSFGSVKMADLPVYCFYSACHTPNPQKNTCSTSFKFRRASCDACSLSASSHHLLLAPFTHLHIGARQHFRSELLPLIISVASPSLEEALRQYLAPIGQQ